MRREEKGRGEEGGEERGGIFCRETTESKGGGGAGKSGNMIM